MANFDFEMADEQYTYSTRDLRWVGWISDKAVYYGFFGYEKEPVFLLRYWAGVLELFEVSYANRVGYWNVGAAPTVVPSAMHEYIDAVTEAILAGGVGSLVLPCMLSREVKAKNRVFEQPRDEQYLEIG